MLASLYIRNFALIENATIEFDQGLNILSGETGAGKSILIQALEVLLGGRGSLDLIRDGEEEAEVVGFFLVKNREISLKRVISRSGRNRAYLDERPITVTTLEEAGDSLVDVASQHAHQILLQPEKHLLLLDEFAGLTDEVKFYQEKLAAYRLCQQDKEGLLLREKEAREKEEFFRYQLKELSEAGLKEGEEDKLKNEKELLKNAVRLGEVCLRSEEAIDSGEEALTTRVARVSKEIHQVSSLDVELLAIGEQLEAALCELREVTRRIHMFGQKVSCDPERLQEVEDRLALISRLKKKHGGSLESMVAKEKEISEDLALLDNFEREIQKKEQELKQLEVDLAQRAEVISKKRKQAAIQISKEIEQELKCLGMGSAKFLVKVEMGEKIFGEMGYDTAEFLIAPNPGEGAHSLAKTASGGELSRIFLAVKKVLREVRPTATCVFDEVDVGIGGGVAEVVGKNLSLLAKTKQVICITHLPQIACFADHHFIIQKKIEKGRTQTQIERLKKEQREEEIARMLAGIKITDKAMAHAREMLRNATRQS